MTSPTNAFRIVTNAITDTSVLFAAGNARIGFSSDVGACLLNATLAVLSVGIRAGSEIMQEKPEPESPSQIKKFLDNPGASIIVNGAFQFLSAASVAVAGGLNGNLTNDAVQRTLAIFTNAGVCNVSRGMALGYAEDSMARRVADSVTGVSSVLGAWLAAGPGTDPSITGAFALGAAISLTQGFNQRVAKATEAYEIPNWLFAGGCFAYAGLGTDPVFITANSLYGAAFLSLICTRRFGGPAQTMKAALSWAKITTRSLALTVALQTDLPQSLQLKKQKKIPSFSHSQKTN